MALSVKFKDQLVGIGDTIRVTQEFKEEEKKRSQIFEGVVISIKGKESGKSITVRKIATGSIGVERIWPIISPSITKVELVKQGKVRRSKLYYLRERKGKAALKIKSKAKVSKKKFIKKKVTSEKKKPRKKG